MFASFQALDREHVSGDVVLNAISSIGLDRYSEDGTQRVAYDFVRSVDFLGGRPRVFFQEAYQCGSKENARHSAVPCML